jgi:hypothetical protein
LSTWFWDYLYISLGGSKGSSLRTYRNLMLTMLLGGLWHGAGWQFVVWGGLHGAGLAATRAWQRWRSASPHQGAAARAVLILLTFHYVCFGWIFFRAEDFGTALSVLRGLGALTGGTANVTPMLWALLGAGLATHLIPGNVVAAAQRMMVRLPAPLQAALLVAVVIAVRLARTTDVVPFIYFQF